MATVPPPQTFPETPPTQPGPAPGEIVPPSPDTDVPDPGNPSQPAELPESPNPE